VAAIKYKDPVSDQWVQLAVVGASQPTIVDFPSPQSTWVIDLGRMVNVVILNSAGDVVEPGSIKYDQTEITMTFSAAFSGKAYCF
jgi:hypothetical protein